MPEARGFPALLFNSVYMELVMAPLMGLTEYMFRNVYHQHFPWFDYAVSPFVSLVDGQRVKPAHSKDVWPENNPHLPIIPQVLGKDADKFVVMAHHLAEMGYTEVNWNMGCPVKGVARKQHGSGLLPHPQLVDAVLSKVVPASPLKVSVKVRLGRENPREIFDLLPVLNSYPLAHVCVHPRIGVQMYEGAIDWDTLDEVIPLIRHKVIYSGDIFTVDDFHRLQQRYPTISSWMLGRGFFADIFLPGRILGEPMDRKICFERFLAFYNDLYTLYAARWDSEKRLLNKMKEYWKSYHVMFPQGHDIFRSVVQCHTRADYEQVVARIMDEQLAAL